MSRIITIKCGRDNCYLIDLIGSAVLVDTCSDKYKNEVIDKIGTLSVKMIILTHGHYDHVGNAKALSERLNAPIAMSKEDYALTKNNTLHPLLTRNLNGSLIKMSMQKNFDKANIEPFEPEIWTFDNQKFEEFGNQIQIIDLPGHTKGSIGVLVDGKDLISGDAMMNFDNKPSESLFSNDFKAVDVSIQKIRRLNPLMIYPGHGKSFYCYEYFK